jgi:hypothetical protein
MPLLLITSNVERDLAIGRVETGFQFSNSILKRLFAKDLGSRIVLAIFRIDAASNSGCFPSLAE